MPEPLKTDATLVRVFRLGVVYPTVRDDGTLHFLADPCRVTKGIIALVLLTCRIRRLRRSWPATSRARWRVRPQEPAQLPIAPQGSQHDSTDPGDRRALWPAEADPALVRSGRKAGALTVR